MKSTNSRVISGLPEILFTFFQMIGEEKIQLLAKYFNFPVEIIRDFLSNEVAKGEQKTGVRFLFLYEKFSPQNQFVEYCLLSRTGRFIRLLDEVNSSVDIREAAAYIESVEPLTKEIEIVWDNQLENKQYYQISDYCPPLYCGPTRS